jgi:hypothetical protein
MAKTSGVVEVSGLHLHTEVFVRRPTAQRVARRTANFGLNLSARKA